MCLVYRPHVNETSEYLQESKNLLPLIRKLKYDTLLFGDFIFLSPNYSIDKTNNKNVFQHVIAKRKTVNANE